MKSNLQGNLLINPIHINAAYTILDEAFFLGTNIFLHFLMARWLSKEEYGAFAVAYSVLILSQSIYSGIFYEPLTIFGSGRYRTNFFKYLSYILYGHLWMSIIFIIAISLIIFFLFSNSILRESLIGLIIVIPGVLLLNIIRRVFYIELKPQKAVLYSSAYFFLVLSIILILKYQEILTVFSSLSVMGGSALMLGLIFVKTFKIEKQNIVNNIKSEVSFKKVVKEHFGYARWAVGAYILNWISSNIYFVVLPIFTSLRETAAYRALFNFIAPIQHLIGALNLLFLPVISKKFYNKEIRSFKRSVNKYTIFIAITTLTYWIFLGSLGEKLINILYAGKYSEFSSYLWSFGFLSFLSTISFPRSCALRAAEKPDKIFIAYFITAISTILSIILISFYRLKGAILGVLGITSINCMNIFLFYNLSIKMEKGCL
ncbi:MAG: hypothetical protein NC926_10030 [Candidatus Omnitrophica bacterium]|nr:hypothetical protein [Candidatus Omnitrophota bacterium]